MTRKYVRLKGYELLNEKKFRCIGLKVGLLACSLMMSVPTVSIAKANIHMTGVEDTNSISPDLNNTPDDDHKDNGEVTNPNDDNPTNQEPEEEIPVYTEVDEVVYAKKTCIVYEAADEESNKLGKLIQYKQYTRVSVGDNGYSQIEFEDTIGYVLTKELVMKKPKVPKNLVDLDDKKYSYHDMTKSLKQLAKYYPDYVSVESIGNTLDNREIYVAVLGNKEAKKHILIQGSMHAREYMNTQLLMGLLEKYLTLYDTGKYKKVSYKELFSNVAVHIVPMANPDGVTLSQYGIKGIKNKKLADKLKKMPGSSNFTRWKANVNGVDLNKNFTYGWTKKTGVYKKSSMNYPGSKALSERESKALANYTENIKGLKTVLSYHCMGNIIYWDYGQKGKLRKECKKLVDLVRKQTSYSLVTQSYKTIHYGGFSDWAVQTLKIPAVTIETGLYYAPVKHSQFKTVWKQNENIIPKVILNVME